jgi:hypothetical protein
MSRIPKNTPPPDSVDEVLHVGRSRADAEVLWAQGQEIADRLDRMAEQVNEEAERERLGDLADALRGL